MSALDDFRMKNPGAASLSDADLITKISGATGIDPGTVAADFGVQINDPGFVSTLKRSGAQMVGGLGEVYGDVTGNRNNAASRWAEDVAFRNPSGINSLADVAENPWLAVKEAVGNAATFLVPGAGLKIAGNVARGAKMLNTARALDNPLTQAAVAGMPSLSEIGESQRESGLPENYLTKYLGAGAVGAIENLGGVQRMMGLGRAPQVLSKADEVAQFGATPWRTVGKTVLRSGLEEGLEEIPQTIIEKGAGYQDPFSAKNLEEAALGGVMGAIGGGVLGAGHGAARGLRHAQIRRDQSVDLLAQGADLGRISDQAQWTKAFMNKAGENGDAWFDQRMNAINQQRLGEAVQNNFTAGLGNIALEDSAMQGPFRTPIDELLWNRQREIAAAQRANLGTTPDMFGGEDSYGYVGESSPVDYAPAVNRDRKQMSLDFNPPEAPPPVLYGNQNQPYAESFNNSREGKFNPALNSRAAGSPMTGAFTQLPIGETGAQVINRLPASQQVNEAVSHPMFPMPTDVGSALATLQQALGQKTPVIEGTPQHSAILAASQILARAGVKLPKGGRATQTQPVAAQAAATTQQKAQPKPAAAPATRADQFRATHSVKRTDSRIGKFLDELDLALQEQQITPEEHADFEKQLAAAWKIKDTKKDKNAAAAHNALAKSYAALIQSRNAKTATASMEGMSEEERLAAGYVKKIVVEKDANGDNVERVEWVIPDTSKRVTKAAKADVEAVDPDDITDPKHEKAVRMHLAGDSTRDIAAALGNSHEHWRGVLLDYGYDAQSKKQKDLAEGAENTGAAYTTDENADPNEPKVDPDDVEDTSVDANPDVHDNDEHVDHALENQGITIRSKITNSAVGAGNDRKMQSAITKAKKSEEGVDPAVEKALRAKKTDAETKLDRKMREEREAAQLAEDQKVLDTSVEQILSGDFSSAASLLVALSGPNHKLLVRRLVDNFGLPQTMQEPKAIVEYFAGVQADAATKTIESGRDTAVEILGEGFHALNLDDQLYFAQYVLELGDNVNSPSIARQIKGEFNAKLASGQSAEAVSATAAGTAENVSVAGLNDEGSGTSAGSPKAVPVVSKKKRRVALSDEAAGRSDTEGQAGEVTRQRKNRLSSLTESVEDGEVKDVLDAIVENYAAEGRASMLDNVREIGVHDKPHDEINYNHEDGTYSILIGQASIKNGRNHILMGVEHEVAHALDDFYVDPQYSDTPMMGVLVAQSRKMYADYANGNKDNVLGEIMQYPFTDNYDSQRTRQEVFAQLMSIYSVESLRAELKKQSPLAYNFIKGVHDAEKAKQAGNTTAKVQRKDNGPDQSGDGKRFRKVTAERIQEVAGPTAARLSTDASTIIGRAAKWFMSLHDLIGKYGNMLPSANDWYKSVRATIATRTQLEGDAESIAARAGKLKPKVLEALNKFVADSTFEQKWGFNATFDKIDGTKRSVTADPEMARRFNALPEDARQIAKDMFLHAEAVKLTKFKLLKELGLSGLFDTQGSLQGPYAPLKRFGNYVAVLKSKELLAAEDAGDKKRVEELKRDYKHYVVSYFDTKGLAKEFAQKEQAKSGWAYAQHFPKAQHIKETSETSQATLQKVLAAMKVEKDKLPPGAYAMIEEVILDMHMRKFDEDNARMNGLKRKNRYGYDEDMVRAFLSHARAEAGFLANLKHGGKTNELFYKMQFAAGKAKDRDAAMEVFNAISNHYAANIDQRETPIQDRITALTSVMQLATNPAYHLQNLTQPFITSVPRLAADFGDYSGAWKALMEGYRVVRSVGTKNIDLSVLEKTRPKLYAALKGASDAGLLDVGMDEDLINFEATRTGYAALDVASKGAKKVIHMLRQVSRRVEGANRISAAVAAFNMAQASGKFKDDAAVNDYVISVLQDTQGDFSRTDAPLIIKKLPKPLVQYRKFQLMMAAHYVKAFNDAFRSESPEARAVGRRALAYSLGHAFATAGALGIPLMNIVGLIFAHTGDDDEPRDLERSLREWIGDEDMAKLLLHGPLWWMGMDAKLAQDKVFSFLPYADWDLTSKEGLKNLGVGLAGPAGSQALKMAGGLEYLSKGDTIKGFEGLLPSGISNGLKAFRIANEGFTLKNGDLMMSPDEINGAALTLDAVGLKSPTMRDLEWTRNQQYEIKEFYQARTKEIQRAYADAYKDGDTEAMTEAREEWMALQEGKDRLRAVFNNSPDELKRQPLSTLLKYPRTQDKREQKLQKSVPE